MPDSYKVLHITFDMGIGGTEQVIKQLVLSTKDQGCDSEIFCIDGSVGAIGEQVASEGVKVGGYKRVGGFDTELIKAIRHRIKEGGFRIVHCHQYTPYLYGFLGAFGTGAKVVFTEHGRFHPDRYRYKAVVINPLIALLTPAIVAISKATRLALNQYEFIPLKKVDVIYNGIQGFERSPDAVAAVKKELNIPENAFVVGTVSRLDPVKNQPMMLRAFQRYLAFKDDAVLLMVGDGPDREMLESLAKDLNISDNVIFCGFKSEPSAYLAAMDLFLLSSHTEGTSMTLLEAMSLGIPSIVTDVGGNPEIVVDNETGFITPPDDDAAFSEGMVKASSPEIMSKLQANSVKRFKDNFSVAQMARHYLNTYQRVSKR